MTDTWPLEKKGFHGTSERERLGYIIRAIAKAEKGDVSAAQDVLRWASAFLKYEPASMPEVLCNYLSSAFDELTGPIFEEGTGWKTSLESADSVLHLMPGKPGRPAESEHDSLVKGIIIVSDVDEERKRLTHEEKPRLPGDDSYLAQAIKNVAKKHHYQSDSTVWDIWSEYSSRFLQ